MVTPSSKISETDPGPAFSLASVLASLHRHGPPHAELVDLVELPEGESDYVSGLIHDVGKIVMSSVFPEHFHAIYYAPPTKAAI